MNSQVVDIGGQVTGFFGYSCIGHLVSNAASVVFILSAIAFFIMLISGGIEWLIAGGDKGKVEIAQKRITNGIIGLAIVAASYAIFQLVLYFFGINLDALCTENPLGS